MTLDDAFNLVGYCWSAASVWATATWIGYERRWCGKAVMVLAHVVWLPTIYAMTVTVVLAGLWHVWLALVSNVAPALAVGLVAMGVVETRRLFRFARLPAGMKPR